MVRAKTVTKIPTPSHPRRSMPMAGIVTPAPSRAVSHETTASMRKLLLCFIIFALTFNLIDRCSITELVHQEQASCSGKL